MSTIFDVPGSNPPNPFITPIQALLNSSNLSAAPAPSPDDTAADLVSTVSTSRDPADSLWELWDAFFTAVATSSTSHTTAIALLDALRAQSPTPLSNVATGSEAERKLRRYTRSDGKLDWPTLPLFSAQWRDVHDILEARRDLDGVRTSTAGDNSTTASTSSSSRRGDEYYLCFCVFSAALLKVTKGKGNVTSIRVFYACSSVLERDGPEVSQPRPHRMSSKQLWALDVRVTATWMRDGGRALWETDHEELRQRSAPALDYKTDLWPSEDGLTRDRWRLWEKRLRALSTDEGILDGETRAVAAEAAEVVAGLLEEKST